MRAAKWRRTLFNALPGRRLHRCQNLFTISRAGAIQHRWRPRKNRRGAVGVALDFTSC